MSGRKPPALTARKLIRALKAHGFVEDRQKGSHLTLVHPVTQKTVTIPVHSGADIGKGLLNHILKVAEISPEEL